MANKRFKDPIYGYIEIDEKLITQVVDSASFQRLRDVMQTSYSPLYASAVHNRFVHSIGVYHLACIASKAFRNKELRIIIPQIEQYINIFQLACLLHDVGHAPFSHTGEKYFLTKGERGALHARLVKLTKDTVLDEEIKKNAYKAAPHELMSAIVALETFPKLIPAKMRSFFARCITGYKYEKNMNESKSILNCLIESLNSKVIDVDRLDYLIRDSYMTGFDTVKIDYIRLLDSIRVMPDESGLYQICYYKTAVSVIENAVYAHDAERKWIQNHPIVLYEIYLLNNIFEQIMRKILVTEVLLPKYLSEKGKRIKHYGTVRLMGDSDILYLMKNLEDSSFADEYYGRRYRKHPIWKSEAEFQAVFLGQEKLLSIIEAEINSLVTHLRSLGLPFIINELSLRECRKDLGDNEILLSKTSDCSEKKKLEISIATRKQHVRFMEIWEGFAREMDVDFEFLIIHADQFNSNFRKQELGNLKILLPELHNPCKFEDVSNVLKAQKSKGEKFFFVYYARKYEGQQISISNLRKQMLYFANEINIDRESINYK